MIHELFKFSMFIGIFAGLFFIVYSNLSKRRGDKSIIYINLFVLFLTLNNLQITLVDNGYVEVNFFIRKLLIPWYALIIPCFYTFVTYYLKVENKVQSFVKFSAFLFVTELIIRIVCISNFYTTESYFIARYAQFEEIINVIYTIFLFVKVVIIFYRQAKLYEFVSGFDNLKWIKQTLSLGFVIIFLWVIAIVFNLNKVLYPEISIYYPLRFSSSILLYWIAYQGFFHYNLLSERIKLREIMAIDKYLIIPYGSYEKSNDADFILIQKDIIENNKYVNPDFNLENFGSEINMSPRKVSQILKNNANMNFTDFINQLRVEKAKQYLVDPQYSDYTILAVGLECGFYSKSTFYRAFSKFSKTTPTAFKLENE